MALKMISTKRDCSIFKMAKSYYDDVHELFVHGDYNRGNIAFENWEKRFIKS
jgi:aminoglycoside phosphotransferase (APT) family kinase protein